jgi:DNA polymerase-3 subunit delta
LEYLADLVSADAHRFYNELSKLASFKAGGTVKKDDITLLVSGEASSNIFKTTDALARKDARTAMLSLEEHWQKNEDPFGVLGMLVWQFRIMLKLSDGAFRNMPAEAVAKKLNLNPWTVKKTMPSLNKFGLLELKSAYKKLADIDLAVKTGKEDIKDALADFVCSFSN